MKRLVAIILCTAFLFAACGNEEVLNTSQAVTTDTLDKGTITEDVEVEFDIASPELLTYMEETIYIELIEKLNSEKYFVENVQAVYISKEYLEEIEYNSKENIYFGYTLSEVEAAFSGEKYVFTLGDNGMTTVKVFEPYDDSFDKVIKNVTIGTGVILVCVTVSVATGGVAPAVSLVFAASAKTGAIIGASSGVFSGVAAGVVTGISTKDFDESLKAATLAASEGFKWGAISGAISGGADATIALKGVTTNGLTMNQAAMIQRETKLPLDFIKSFHSVDEYNVYKEAGLLPQKVNGTLAYTQEIDWNLVGDLNDGRTNAERVIAGLAPLDEFGNSYELHHIGQMQNSPLAVLKSSQHKENYSILHKNTGSSASEVNHGSAWEKQKDYFWAGFLALTVQ